MSVALPSNTSLSIRTTTGPDVFVNIPGVFEFNFGDRQAETIDTTDFDSPNDSEESEAGITRAQNGSLSFHWEPGETTQEMIRAAKGQTKVLRSLEGGWQSTATVVILGNAVPRTVGGKRVCTVAIKLTGDIVEVEV